MSAFRLFNEQMSSNASCIEGTGSRRPAEGHRGPEWRQALVLPRRSEHHARTSRAPAWAVGGGAAGPSVPQMSRAVLPAYPGTLLWRWEPPAPPLTLSMRSSTAGRVTQQWPPDASCSCTMSPLWLEASYSSWLKYSASDSGQAGHTPSPVLSTPAPRTPARWGKRVLFTALAFPSGAVPATFTLSHGPGRCSIRAWAWGMGGRGERWKKGWIAGQTGADRQTPPPSLPKLQTFVSNF